MVCEICGRQYFYDRKRGHTKSKCNSCSVNRRRFEVKKKVVEYLGGSCRECGYDRSLRALHAHHLSSENKDFSISGKHSLSWSKIEVELQKCILLCSNCHAEVHEKKELELGLAKWKSKE